MSNDKTEERATFEAWFKRAYSEDSLKPTESGCYLQRGAGMAWDAWQARAALPSRPAQGVALIDEGDMSSAPAQPVREPMTDEQVLAALASCTNEPPRRLPPGFAAFARAIERHHRID